MALTAKEWLLLSEEEQQKRGKELSPHECFLLRSTYAYVHFTEEEKANMTKEEKEQFLREPTKEEKRKFTEESNRELERVLEMYRKGEI